MKATKPDLRPASGFGGTVGLALYRGYFAQAARGFHHIDECGFDLFPLRVFKPQSGLTQSWRSLKCVRARLSNARISSA